VDPFIERYDELLTENLRDPVTSKRLTRAKRLRDLHSAQKDIFERLQRASGQESLIGYTELDITLTADQEFYALPPAFRNFISLEQRDSTNTQIVLECLHTIPLFSKEVGIQILDGQRGFRVQPTPTETKTWTLSYLKGPIVLHYATAQAAAASTITFDDPASADAGELVSLDDYYAGSLVHVYSASTAGERQVREVSAYDATTKVATVRVPWGTTPAGTILYEILPDVPDGLDEIYALLVAIKNTGRRANRSRRVELERNFDRLFAAAKSYYNSNTKDRAPVRVQRPQHDSYNPYDHMIGT
jgi:hypothetical protein